jgi:putative phage-type endonuclease
MIVHDVQQGSPEWLELRRGRVTASSASRLLTPTGKLSSSMDDEVGRVVAELMELQDPEYTQPTEWMQRGIDLEAEAVDAFSLITDYESEPIGFVTNTAFDYAGCSPDRMVKADPLEIKCPKPSTHLRWLANAGNVPAEYRAQLAMQMVLCAAERGWFMSYCPGAKPVLISVHWDDYTDAMSEALDDFARRVDTMTAKLKENSE